MHKEESPIPFFDKATSGYYQLFFPKLPVTNLLGRNLVLNIFNTEIPSVSIPPHEEYWQGAVMKMPGKNVNFSPWQFSFVVDEKMQNWQVMFEWLTFINNNKDDYVEDFPSYLVNPVLHVIDNFQRTVLKLRFVNSWISDLGSLSLNTRNNESLLEGSCTLQYDRYEYEGSN